MNARERADEICRVATQDDLKTRIFQAICAVESESYSRGYAAGLRDADMSEASECAISGHVACTHPFGCECGYMPKTSIVCSRCDDAFSKDDATVKWAKP